MFEYRVKCNHCGKEFIKEFPNQKYCNDTCAKEKRKEKRNEWLKKNPHYAADYFRARRKNEYLMRMKNIEMR